jgi:hypothetical protein
LASQTWLNVKYFSFIKELSTFMVESKKRYLSYNYSQNWYISNSSSVLKAAHLFPFCSS